MCCCLVFCLALVSVIFVHVSKSILIEKEWRLDDKFDRA